MVVIPIGLLWPISELSYPVTAMSYGTEIPFSSSMEMTASAIWSL